MKYDVNASFRRLALMIGGVGGIIVFLFLELLGMDTSVAWAMMTFALLTFSASLFFWIVLHSTHKSRYQDIPATIPNPILFTVHAYVTVEEQTRNGYLYLTADELICHFRDQSPYRKVVFSKVSRFRITLKSPVTVEISDARHVFEVVSTQAEYLAQKMKEHGWVVISNPEE